MEALKFFKTHAFNHLPKKQTDGSACFDLMFQGSGKSEYTGYTKNNKQFTRIMNNQIVVQPGERVMVPTGLIMDIPNGYSVRVHPRSGMSLKQGLILANCEGVIDSDYVQEVMILILNVSENQITIKTGDRIAQAELVKDVSYDIMETSLRPGIKTNRIGGMGSTGIQAIGETITFSVKDPVEEVQLKRGRGRPKKATL